MACASAATGLLRLLHERGASADHGIGMADHEVFDSRIGAHDEVAALAFLVARWVGVLLEDKPGAADARGEPRDDAGVLDAMHHGVTVADHHAERHEQHDAVEGELEERRPDRDFLREEKVRRANYADAGNLAALAERKREEIDLVAELGERHHVEAQAYRRTTPLEKRLRGNEEYAFGFVFGFHGRKHELEMTFAS